MGYETWKSMKIKALKKTEDLRRRNFTCCVLLLKHFKLEYFRLNVLISEHVYVTKYLAGLRY